MASKAPAKTKSPSSKAAASRPAKSAVARKKPAAKAVAKKAKAKPAAAKGKAAAPAKKPAAKKPADPKAKAKAAPAKAAPAKKPAAKKPAPAAAKKPAAPAAKPKPVKEAQQVNGKGAAGPVKVTGFLRRQHQRLLELRDSLMDQMAGVARDTLRTHPEGSEASAFGMHQADAGSDAYDRDFALNLLSKEQDALYEIEEALKRIEKGTYGVCEMSGKKIAQARLEAMPFARFTVECQAQIEREQMSGNYRVPVRSLFGLQGDGSEEGSESLDDDKN